MLFLVTGCAGFIGASLCHQILAQGDEVIGIDNLDATLYPAEIKSNRLDSLQSFENFHFFNRNLVIENIDSLISQSSVVFNMAGLPGQLLSWDRTLEYFQTNAIVVSNMLKSISRSGKKIRLVQASTSSVYGSNAWGDETIPLLPCSPYGISKLSAEQLLHAHGSEFDIDYVILRFFSVYGPGQRPDMAISRFLNSIHHDLPIDIYGDGTQVRDCTFVEDIVSGTLLASKFGGVGETYNLSSGNPITLNQILNTCFEITGKRVPLNYKQRKVGDQSRTFGDSSKAAKQLGYEPRFSLAEGLTKQWDSDFN
jgi:UDP-glucose 4-epimerase